MGAKWHGVKKVERNRGTWAGVPAPSQTALVEQFFFLSVKERLFCVWRLARLIVVTGSQYRQTLNHYVVHLKLTQRYVI